MLEESKHLGNSLSGRLKFRLRGAFALLELPECRGGHPSNTLSGIIDLSIQLIYLLQGEALGFVDHEVNKCNADEAAPSPDEKDLGLQVGIALSIIHEVWSRICDCPVQEPVGSRGHGEGLGADLQWEDFSCNDPE